MDYVCGLGTKKRPWNIFTYLTKYRCYRDLNITLVYIAFSPPRNITVCLCVFVLTAGVLANGSASCWPHLGNRQSLFPPLPVPPFWHTRAHSHTNELTRLLTQTLALMPKNDAGTQTHEKHSQWRVGFKYNRKHSPLKDCVCWSVTYCDKLT